MAALKHRRERDAYERARSDQKLSSNKRVTRSSLKGQSTFSDPTLRTQAAWLGGLGGIGVGLTPVLTRLRKTHVGMTQISSVSKVSGMRKPPCTTRVE